MDKPLALRPKESHPLHVLREFEVWPVPTAPAVPDALRARVLANLPRFERADEVPWGNVALRSDKAPGEFTEYNRALGGALMKGKQ